MFGVLASAKVGAQTALLALLESSAAGGIKQLAKNQSQSLVCTRSGTWAAFGMSSKLANPFLDCQAPKIMIIGPPGCGKGTQCQEIVKKYGMVHVSVGELLRHTQDDGIKPETLDSGRLVSDDLVIDLVYDRLQKADVKKRGFLLDGYPRNPTQARAIKDLNIVPDILIQLQVSDKVAMERIAGRRTDPISGVVYHQTFNPPPSAIAAQMFTRSDDNGDAIKERLETYNANIDGIMSQYRSQQYVVEGEQPIPEVFADIDNILHHKLFNQRYN